MKSITVISAFSFLACAGLTAVASAQPAVHIGSYPPDQQPGIQATPPPSTDRSHRGFTVGLGIGIASVSDNQKKSAGATNGRFFVGAWLSRATALTFDASSYYEPFDGNAASDARYHVFIVYGVGVQQYVGARSWIGGTVGAATKSKITASTQSVLGLVGRGGYNILERGPHALALTLDVAVGFFDTNPRVGVSAGIGYQLL